MEYLNVHVNYDVYDYDENDYVQYQHQYSLVYIDKFHWFYSNDYAVENEKNSKEIDFNKKFFYEVKRILRDHIYNEQTNGEILLINKMCRALKEKNCKYMRKCFFLLNTY